MSDTWHGSMMCAMCQGHSKRWKWNNSVEGEKKKKKEKKEGGKKKRKE